MISNYCSTKVCNCTAGCLRCEQGTTGNTVDLDWDGGWVSVSTADYPEYNEPEPIKVKIDFDIPEKRVSRPVSRLNVKIHNPPGGWGMGRF